jgi:hypothetical protein
MFQWMKKVSLLPPCIHPREDLTAPRSETSDEPFDAGFEDRMAGRPMSIHRAPYYTLCQCTRCREYQAGYNLAERQRMKALAKRKEDQ